jgi:hypothetical protein
VAAAVSRAGEGRGLPRADRGTGRRSPDATLGELKAWLLAAYGVAAGTTLIWETPDERDLTYKTDHSRG